MGIFSRSNDNPDDARNWTPADAIRNQQELDDVHLRAYNPDKDEIIDQQHISDSDGGKAEAERIRDTVDARAKQRGVNVSAQVVKQRGGGYKVFTYRPKKLCTRLEVCFASTGQTSTSFLFTSTAVAGLTYISPRSMFRLPGSRTGLIT